MLQNQLVRNQRGTNFEGQFLNARMMGKKPFFEGTTCAFKLSCQQELHVVNFWNLGENACGLGSVIQL